MNKPSGLDYLKSKLGMSKIIDFPREEISLPESENEFSAETKSPFKRTWYFSMGFQSHVF